MIQCLTRSSSGPKSWRVWSGELQSSGLPVISPLAIRILLAASTVLLTAAVLFAFLGGPEIGSAYLLSTGLAGVDLPNLTANVALPLLRIDASSAHERPINRPWALFVWVLLFVTPALVLTWALNGPTPESTVARWIVGHSVYLPIAILVSIVVVVGLALPFACL